MQVENTEQYCLWWNWVVKHQDIHNVCTMNIVWGRMFVQQIIGFCRCLSWPLWYFFYYFETISQRKQRNTRFLKIYLLWFKVCAKMCEQLYPIPTFPRRCSTEKTSRRFALNQMYNEWIYVFCTFNACHEWNVWYSTVLFLSSTIIPRPMSCLRLTFQLIWQQMLFSVNRTVFPDRLNKFFNAQNYPHCNAYLPPS